MDGGEGIQRQLGDVSELYKKDFPPPPEPSATSAAVVRHPAAPGLDLEVKMSDDVIENDEDFKRRLALHSKLAEEHEATEIRNYLNSRIQWLTDELDSASIAAKARD